MRHQRREVPSRALGLNPDARLVGNAVHARARVEMHEKSELSLEQAQDGTRNRLNIGSVNVTLSRQPDHPLAVNVVDTESLPGACILRK